MNEPLISVIMPVYNTERYLQHAIDSVLNQTYHNLELILVDDGSTDGSGRICKQAAEQDMRVLTLCQSNRGAAVARNLGLSAAHGDWILFIDSDDFYWRNDTMKLLQGYAAESGAQVLCFDSCRIGEDGHTVGKETSGGVCLETVREMMRSNRYTSSPCLKLLRRSLFSEHALEFESGMYCEDVEWSLRLLFSGARIAYLPETMYCYRIRAGSVTQSISPKHVSDLLHAVEQCREDCLACGDEALRELGLAYTAFQYCTLLINLRLSNPRVERAVAKRIFALKQLLQYDAIPAVRLVHRTSRVLGIWAASWILTAYFRLFQTTAA